MEAAAVQPADHDDHEDREYDEGCIVDAGAVGQDHGAHLPNRRARPPTV